MIWNVRLQLSEDGETTSDSLTHAPFILAEPDGMKSGVPSWYVLEAQVFHPEEGTP